MKRYRAKRLTILRNCRPVFLVAPQGFEPRYSAPEADVLPLNEGAFIERGSVQKTF